MAELCTRKECVAEIGRIVRRAKEKIVLVSPFIDVDEEILERLKQKTDDGVEIVVIWGKKKNQPKAKSILDVSGVTEIFIENLHAKCYLNEDEALISSMNLYEYSQNNNEELGILVTRENDEQLYEEIIQEVRRWESKVQKQPPKAKKQSEPKESLMPQGKKVLVPTVGSCIRCHDGVLINPTDLRPYCQTCHFKWRGASQTKEHPENYCHVCGTRYQTSLSKPACKECWEKYRYAIDFKSAIVKIA